MSSGYRRGGGRVFLGNASGLAYADFIDPTPCVDANGTAWFSMAGDNWIVEIAATSRCRDDRSNTADLPDPGRSAICSGLHAVTHVRPDAHPDCHR
ncbi:hypothetical protein ACQP1O_20495 [Nocardia sp. CA-151230]|uniref:hypothetical protein n=1 Tax=Nocardia sp. CA-151230 TaxID=3239982 RepID=UPI003D92A064